MGGTRRPLRQARAIPVRGRRTHRLPRPRRTPAAALVLSLLALLAPDLLLAPTLAGDEVGGPPAALRWLEESPPAAEPAAADAELVVSDRRTAGGLVATPPRAPTEPAAPAPTSVDSATWQHSLDAARGRGGAHGITFAAVRDGELLWSGSSGRARDGRTPLAPDAPMVIGSVTKTYVAATVLRLAENGRLHLDDPVRDHLPELETLSRKVTVRQLLDHTSGLADLFNDTTRRGLEDAPERGWTSVEILETLRAPWYDPGEGWAYANTNYFLLGLLVERLSGATLADAMTDGLLAPMGMTGTRVLTGVEDEPLAPAWTTIFWASGAMVAPAADVARWGDSLYAGDVLSPESRAAMLTVNDHDYGLGAQHIEIGRVEGVGHTGLLNTYTTLLFHVPDEDVTVALLVNRSHVDLAAMLQAAPKDGASLLDLARGRR